MNSDRLSSLNLIVLLFAISALQRINFQFYSIPYLYIYGKKINHKQRVDPRFNSNTCLWFQPREGYLCNSLAKSTLRTLCP